METSTGTVLVRDILPGASDARPHYLTNVNGTLYFQANDGATGYELWKSDGTSTGLCWCATFSRALAVPCRVILRT